jgi:hypothetical protein
MVTIEDVAAMASALPGVTEGTSYGNRSWNVGKHHFVWERPFSKADIKRFGDDPVPAGPIVALRVEDEHEKQAVLVSGLSGVFTIPHFDRYPAVLVQLPAIGTRAMPRPGARRLARRGARTARPRTPGATTQRPIRSRRALTSTCRRAKRHSTCSTSARRRSAPRSGVR